MSGPVEEKAGAYQATATNTNAKLHVQCRLKPDDHAYVVAIGEGSPCKGLERAVARLRTLEREVARQKPTQAVSATITSAPDKVAGCVAQLAPMWTKYTATAKPARAEALAWISGRLKVPSRSQLAEQVLERLEKVMGGVVS